MKYLTILSLFIFSCSHTNVTSEKFVTNQLQENNISEFAKGEEIYYTILEVFIHNPHKYQDNNKLIERNKVTQKYLTKLKEIDNENLKFFNNLKKKSLEKNQPGLSKHFVKKEHIDKSMPLFYDLKSITSNSQINILEENKTLILSKTRQYRNRIISLYIQWLNEFRKEQNYTFKDPQINQFKDQKEFDRLFEIKIKKSILPIDEYDVIKQIYYTLSIPNSKQIFTQNSWFLSFNTLLTIEKKILTARSEVLALIKMYSIGCGSGFSVTNIEPLVSGPSTALVGDTIELSTRLVMFDTLVKTKYYTIDKSIDSKVHNGLGNFKYIVPNKNEMTLKGKLLVLQKNGDYKTFDWNHKVEIRRQ